MRETDKTATAAAQDLPRPIVSLLVAAQRQENLEGAASRRVAYRTTRIVIGALVEAGYAVAAIAAVLQTTPESVRRRIERDGELSEEAISALTGMRVPVLRRAAVRHGIEYRSPSEGAPVTFRVLDIVGMLIAEPSPLRPRSTPAWRVPTS